MVVGLNPVAVAYTSDMAPASSKKFLDIQASSECRFTLKLTRYMIVAYSDSFQPKLSNELYILKSSSEHLTYFYI